MIHENWYPDEQLQKLKALAGRVKGIKGSVVEIGCWEGKSTKVIVEAVHPDKVYCVDTWRGNVAESLVTGEQHITEQIVKERDVLTEFIFNMNKAQGYYQVCQMECVEWLKSCKLPIKFCHVDASHDYYSVRNTLMLLKPMVVKCGVICGDDFIHAHAGRTDLAGGVERAVREVLPDFENNGNIWFWVNR